MSSSVGNMDMPRLSADSAKPMDASRTATGTPVRTSWESEGSSTSSRGRRASTASQEEEEGPSADRQAFQAKRTAGQSTIQLFLNSPMEEEEERPTWRKRVWMLMEEPSGHPVALKVHYSWSVLIILSVLSTVIQTMSSLNQDVKAVLMDVELFFNTLFTLEVLVRVICAPQKIVLLRNMYIWMDFGAIVPFYIVLIIGRGNENMYFELMGLLIPILRLLKITRHSVGWRILMQSVRECADPLCVPAFLLLLMTVIASCVIFWLEKHFGPDDEQMVFESIPHAMWFVICTISTVGYGDVYPRSEAAKTAAATLILGGVCYMAMPLAIIGGTFVNVYQERERLLLREKTSKRFAEGGLSPSHLRSLFEAADQDHSGCLGLSEFVDMVEAFGLGFSRYQIVKLFQSVDRTGTGEVSFQAFSFFLFPEIELPEESPNDVDISAQEHLKGGHTRLPDTKAMNSEPFQAPGTWRSPCPSPRPDGRLRLAPMRPPGEPPFGAPSARSSTSSADSLVSANRGPSNVALAGRVERLEGAVARLGAEQRRYHQAQQRILEDIAAKLCIQSSWVSSQPHAKRLPSSEEVLMEAVLPGGAP